MIQALTQILMALVNQHKVQMGANPGATGPATAGDVDGGAEPGGQDHYSGPGKGRDESYGRTSERDRGIDAYASALAELDSDLESTTSALEALRDVPIDYGQDIDLDDEDEDYSGMPTGATVDQTVAALIQAIQDPKEARNYGWNAQALARSILGLPPSTAETRAADALANLESQGQQEAMEMDVSTGEDDRKRMQDRVTIKQFRDEYEWTEGLSDDVVLAYATDPTLLQLKLDNVKMLDTIEAQQAKPALTSGVSPRQVISNPMSVYA
jgi:hypothetical protein